MSTNASFRKRVVLVFCACCCGSGGGGISTLFDIVHRHRHAHMIMVSTCAWHYVPPLSLARRARTPRPPLGSCVCVCVCVCVWGVLVASYAHVLAIHCIPCANILEHGRPMYTRTSQHVRRTNHHAPHTRQTRGCTCLSCFCVAVCASIFCWRACCCTRACCWLVCCCCCCDSCRLPDTNTTFRLSTMTLNCLGSLPAGSHVT